MLTVLLALILVTEAFGHEMRIVNNCNFALNIGIRGDDYTPEGGGFNLGPKQIKSVQVPNGWTSGRIWGRTGCGSNNCCQTGDCGCRLACGGLTGTMDVTLAEFGLDKYQGNDFYDISLVDGFNVAMKIEPIAGTFKTSPFGDPNYDCRAPLCNYPILNDCPNELREIKNGITVSCLSACSKFQTQEYCCPNGSPFGSPQTCQASPYASYFKQRCPDAYSYAFDDQKSTFACRSADGMSSGYITTFCP